MRAAVAAIALFASVLGAQPRTSTTLDVYVVDVEGGNATLIVSPSRESLLIDTGNDGAGAVRDAKRIEDAIKDAGLQQIDHLITTHWHSDHFGGMAELASRVKIREFIDHGPNVQPGEAADTFLAKTYPALYSKAKHTVVKAGDRISMAGIEVRVVTSAARRLRRPFPAPASRIRIAPIQTWRQQRRGPSIRRSPPYVWKFRAIHLGDLTKNKEFELMCPNNRLGAVDVLLGLHHGQDTSSSEVLVHALHPRVAIMNDGTRKGGQPEVMKILHSSPGLEDLWQLHFSLLSGQEYTVPGMFIANTVDDQQQAMPISPVPATQPAPVHSGTAYWIKLSAQQDGSFTVTNARNGFSKTYKGRP